MFIKPKRPGPQEASITPSEVMERDMEEARQMILAGDTTTKIADWLGWSVPKVNALRLVVAAEWKEKQRMDMLEREALDFIQKHNPKEVAVELAKLRRQVAEAQPLVARAAAELSSGRPVAVQGTLNHLAAILAG